MAEEKKVIIDIAVNSGDAVKNIQNARAAIDDLKKSQKELEEQGKKNSAEYIANEAAIRRYNDTIRANQKEIDNNIKKEKAAKDSLAAMRAELANLIRQYDNLSKAERESAKGEDLLKSVKETTQGIKDLEEETLRYQRNVGNYPKVFDIAGTTMGKFATMIDGVTGGAKNVGVGLKNAGQAVAAFGKQLLSLLANPIVAIIAAIAAAVMELVEAFKKNDEAMTTLETAMAAFKPIGEAISWVFDKLALVVSKVVSGITEAATAILSLIPAFRDAKKEDQELVVATDNLEEAERQYTVNSAKRRRDVAEIRAKAADKEKYTAAERMKYLQQAMDIERKELAEASKIAAEKLRIAKAQAKQNKDTSDETANNIAQLEAAAIDAQAAYYQADRKLRKEYQRALDEDRREEEEKRKQQIEAAKKAAEERKKIREQELAETRKLEDLNLAMMKDGLAKTEEQLRVSAKRSIEDIDKKIREGGLSKKTIAALNCQKKAIEDTLTINIAKLYTDEAQKQYAEILTKQSSFYQQQLEIAGNNEAKKLNLQLQALEVQRNQALSNEKLTQEEIINLNAYYDAKRLKMTEDAEKKKAEIVRQVAEQQYANALAVELQGVEGNEAAKSEIIYREAQRRLADAQAESQRLKALTEEEAENMYGSVEAWQLKVVQADAAVIEANNQTAASFKALSSQQKTNALAIGNAATSVVGTISELTQTMADNDERYKNFAMGIAMAEIWTKAAIATATAVVAATESGAATGPGAFVATPIFIAELVAIVGGAIASSIATLNKAKQSSSAYATGGYVSGAGTGTSDSINAKLSNGEFVVNAAATKRYLPTLALMNGGMGNGGRRFAAGGMVGLDALQSSFANSQFTQTITEAMGNIQPVVSVKEITRVANRVQAKERISMS